MKNLAKIARVNLVLKAIQVVSNSYYLGLISRKLTTIEFGEIMLLVSLQTFTLNLDFGFGQAIRNKVVELRSKFDFFGISKYMSSVLLFLLISSIFLLILCFNPFLSIQNFIYEKIIKQPSIHSLPLITIYLISQVIIVPLNTLIFIFYSFHRVIEKSFFEMLSPLLASIILTLRTFNLNITGLIIFSTPFFVAFISFIYLMISEKIEINLYRVKLIFIRDLWQDS